MGDKGRLPPLLFPVAGLGFAARRLLEQTRRQLARHEMQRGRTIDLILVVPDAHGGAIPLHAERRVSRWHQRKTRFVLAQQDAPPRLRFFFTAASSPWVTCWGVGSPRR